MTGITIAKPKSTKGQGNDLQNTTLNATKDWTTRNPLKPGGRTRVFIFRGLFNISEYFEILLNVNMKSP